MKTRILSALIIPAFFAACEKNGQPELQAPEEMVTIHAILPEDDASRGAGIKTQLSWTWNEGDEITVVGETTETFQIKEGFSPKQAEFVGKAVKGTSFTILYPDSDIAESVFSSQTQKGNGDLSHLHYEAALGDVDTYTTFAFSPEWAAEHGGTLKQTGVIKFDIALPEGVSTPEGVALGADEDIFFSGNGDGRTNKLSLALTDCDASKGVLTAWMISSWNEAVISAGTAVTVSVKAGGKVYTQTLSKAEDITVKSGAVNTITISDTSKWLDDTPRYAGGSGTKASPWIIENTEQMLYIQEDLLEGGCRYYRLGADIDMTGVEWTPLNTADPYNKKIDFDGDGHTISNFSCNAAKYPSMFGVLYGSVRNLTFKDASINCTSATAAGVVAGYFGTGDKDATLSNVHVEGTVTNSGAYAGIGGIAGKAAASVYESPAITGCSFKGTLTSTGAKNGVGGILGIAQNMLIQKSWVDATINNNANYAGGLVGYESGKIEIADCWSEGSLTANQRIGGIIGGIIKTETIVRNCWSGMALSAGFVMGGIVGHASLDKWSADTSEPANHVEKCIAWNSSIKTTGTPSDTYGDRGSSGAVVGYTSVRNYLSGCLRKNGLDFTEIWLGNVPYDQEDASPSAPLQEAVSQTYNYPYHGKAVAAGTTLSQAAQSLGWSSDTWDFSGEKPKLK